VEDAVTAAARDPLREADAAAAVTPPAVVVGVGWVAGLAAIRSLGRAGVRVLAVDDRSGALGFRSRYAESRLAPDRLERRGDFVRFLADLGEGVAFSTHDDDLETIARHRDELALTCPSPGWDVLGRIQDKRHQLAIAAEAGVAVPRSADEPTVELGFPVVVKPSDPTAFRRRFGVKAFRCADRCELERRFEDARGHAPLVQEWIPGGDAALFTVGSYLTRGGEALGVFTGRKLLQTPREIGTARVAEARWLPALAEDALRLLRGLGFHGISQVELKRDARDGRFKLIEVNPRLWEWHGLAMACGVDLPRIAYLDAVGEPPPPVRMHSDGKRWAITLARGARLAFQRPPYVDAMWARDDPRPAFVHWARVVRP
jgi:predicted ATP-grasp superfamily ATP-dependent carboligase